jgi:hypothetical protein
MSTHGRTTTNLWGHWRWCLADDVPSLAPGFWLDSGVGGSSIRWMTAKSEGWETFVKGAGWSRSGRGPIQQLTWPIVVTGGEADQHADYVE